MLSNKAKYALKAAGYLAARFNTPPVQILEVAKAKNIPLKFLENILLELRKAGVLESKKGKGGGYFFKQDPATISIAKVIRAIDGPIAMLPCVSLNFYKKCDDCDETNCRIKRVFAEARDATIRVLEDKMLNELAEIQTMLTSD